MPRGAVEGARPRVELLWFEDCPNHIRARVLLEEVLADLAPGTAVHDVTGRRSVLPGPRRLDAPLPPLRAIGFAADRGSTIAR